MVCLPHPELGAIRIVWDGHPYLDVVRGAASLELCLALDDVLDAGAAMAFDGGFDPYQGLDGRRESVGHELEFAVGRDERDGAVVFEAAETDALVELDVLHLDGLAARGWSGRASERAVSQVVVSCVHKG